MSSSPQAGTRPSKETLTNEIESAAVNLKDRLASLNQRLSGCVVKLSGSWPMAVASEAPSKQPPSESSHLARLTSTFSATGVQLDELDQTIQQLERYV